MQVRILTRIDDVAAGAWNALAGVDNPFTRHEFLAALERNACVGADLGWIPRHLLLYDGDRLAAAMPLYLKDNSYGEFVFDWAWADAYERAGGRYYPKLVTAVPYTPATGPRLLATSDSARGALIDAAVELARSLGVSSLHWLFTDDTDTRALEQHGLLRRSGCQFHWHNANYSDFEHFLSSFSSKKRKKVRRERRQVHEAGVRVELLHGGDVSDAQWRTFHAFYCSTFDRKSGYPTLTLEFFREIGRTMPDDVVLLLASYQGRHVAGAFNIRGRHVLYGRHWGCSERFHSLHFELCYYRAIEYCIEHGLSGFEAGAQGEHKISRGFVPVTTYSAHWLADRAFSDAVADFLVREENGIQHYMDALAEHAPYRRGGE